MIVTDLKLIERQMPLSPTLVKAIEFLRRPDLASLDAERVEIDGDRVFALPQRCETVPPEKARYEYHRRYIDLQFILEGEETIGWAPAARMRITEAYDREKDITFGDVPPGEATLVRLQAGQVAVFYPEDAHAPRLASRGPAAVRKVVVKVEVKGF